MAANTIPGVARLEKALQHIGHQQPSFSIRAGIFNKSGGSKRYTHNNALIQQAKATGWEPLDDQFGADYTDETWATHLALQDFGVGVGHGLYDEMLEKYAPRNHAALTKEGLVSKFGLKAHASNLANLHHKDLLSKAILTDIARKYFEDYGEVEMIVEESRKIKTINAEIKSKKQDEAEREESYRKHQIPPKRAFPWEEDAERAKAKRVTKGRNAVTAERGSPFQSPTPSPESPTARDSSRLARLTSSSSTQNPFATPSSTFRAPRAEGAAAAPSTVSGTPRATTAFQLRPYARGSVRNQDEEDETLDAVDEFNPF